MPLPTLSEATLRRNADPDVFARGEGYYRAGAVVALTQRGQTLQAEVEGSEARPYDVHLSFDGGGLTSAYCTCAYSFGGWCKHIVATLLMCLRQTEGIETRPTLAQLLEPLDREQTQQVLHALVAEQPLLIEAIDRYVGLMTTPTPAPQSAMSPRHTPVDPAPFRREVRDILRNAVDAWESGWDDNTITEDLQAVIDKAQDFTARGDGHNALVILAAIAEACGNNWGDVTDYGVESDGVASALDQAWAEAILSTDLAPQEKADLEKKLTNGQKALDSTFAISLEALHHGWDYPPLQRVLLGEITELGAWEGEAPDYADELALIRLRILDRQERYQEYLYLAQAEGQNEHYLTMLGRLGQVDTAMEAAKTHLGTLDEAFALAQVLRQQGALQQALDIAQTGLTLPGQALRQHELAVWTSELAEGLGNHPVTLAARMTAFRAKPSLGDYRKVEELAGETWATVRKDLLQTLQNHSAWGSEHAKVDIFLHEGLIDNAITVVKNISFYQSELVQRVMDAAMTQAPDWVIDNARHRAEEIMDAGKANAYHHAIDWLGKARSAYLAADRQAEWATYRERLIHTHGRKYKLMGMLENRDMA